MIESSLVPRMGAEAARVDALAAREIWKALGVPDRMGMTEANIGHCTWHASFTPDLEAYLDKFLLGKTDGAGAESARQTAGRTVPGQLLESGWPSRLRPASARARTLLAAGSDAPK